MVRDPAQDKRFDDLGVPWVAGDLEMGAPSAVDLEGFDTVIFAAGAGRDQPDIKKVSIDYLGAVRSMAGPRRPVRSGGLYSCRESTRIRRERDDRRTHPETTFWGRCPRGIA